MTSTFPCIDNVRQMILLGSDVLLNFLTYFRGVLVSGDFGRLGTSWCTRFHCNVMRISMKMCMNQHKVKQNEHNTLEFQVNLQKDQKMVEIFSEIYFSEKVPFFEEVCSQK